MVTANNPLDEIHGLVGAKPHWLCRIFGHKYVSISWISYTKKIITGYSMCERCGDVLGATTFGPFEFKVKIPAKE